jgi:glycosyltransferase involved in cell wall biosynthesis
LIISRIVCYLLGVPLVGTFVNLRYGSERKGLFKGFDFSKYFLTWLLDRLTSHIPVKIISNSYDIAVQNGKSLGIKREKIKVIYRGRDSQKINQWAYRKPVGIFKWVAIGRLIPQKGYDDLIGAIFELKNQGYSIHLDIIGEGPLHDHLKEKIISKHLEDTIQLRGNIPFAWRELYDGNAFVLTSHSEGFSGALVEALMTGIPIVASDIPMNVEAISPGKDAYIYKTGDVDDLIVKMRNLMNNYEQACKKSLIARSRAIDNYDIRNIASIYEQSLKDIIRNNSK